ncbi:hypothetical protein PV04_09762 [Phialophora macrospora]|uniref:Dynamin GTPase domain-containing protein n=1 Tax=Phialophora macrospora TaxID=1851006 RepID=A0A0D2F7D1_9EURO|nr:hypothetical protein PV04_09762 [Phialophora macrospora]
MALGKIGKIPAKLSYKTQSPRPSQRQPAVTPSQLLVKKVYDLIDDLKSSDVAKDLELPEMVVCGDQSAGKSSFLHSLTGIPFPVSDKACTRFATILRMRSADVAAPVYSAQIMPSFDTTDEDEIGRLRKYTPVLHDLSQVGAVTAEAAKHMQVEGTGFSPHTLVINVAARGSMNLTLVDLPGIFNSPTAKQTVEDLERVKQITRAHITRKRTIIVYIRAMIVEDANANLRKEIVECDPGGKRTFCVLTKPDLFKPLQSPSIAKDFERQLNEQVPWATHIVMNRNLTTLDTSGDVRLADELNCLEVEPWASVDDGHKGIDTLSPRLCKMFEEHVFQLLPDIADDLTRKNETLRAELARMPPPPQAITTRTLFAAHPEFERLVRSAGRGDHYDRFFDNGGNQLRFQIRDRVSQLMRALNTRAVPTTEHLDPKIAKQYGIPEREGVADHVLRDRITEKLGKATIPTVHFEQEAAELLDKLVKPWDEHTKSAISGIASEGVAFAGAAFTGAVQKKGAGQSVLTLGATVATTLSDMISHRLENLLEPRRRERDKKTTFPEATGFLTKANLIESIRLSAETAATDRQNSVQSSDALCLRSLLDSLADIQLPSRSTAAAIIMCVDACYQQHVDKLSVDLGETEVSRLVEECLLDTLSLSNIASTPQDQLFDVDDAGLPAMSEERARCQGRIAKLEDFQRKLADIRREVHPNKRPATPEEDEDGERRKRGRLEDWPLLS